MSWCGICGGNVECGEDECPPRERALADQLVPAEGVE